MAGAAQGQDAEGADSGDGVAYFGDHVEMTDGGDDFASTVGIGGVIGTNFAWPGAPGKKDKTLAAHARAGEGVGASGRGSTRRSGCRRASIWAASTTSASTGRRRTPSEKDDAMYYAFYAPRFSGEVELRGLGAGRLSRARLRGGPGARAA